MNSSRFSLDATESIAYQGVATYQNGIIGVGGNMILTSGRLIFNSHKLNFGQKYLIISLNDIHKVSKVWTKILGIIPVLPNGLNVQKIDGSNYVFAVFNRNEWIAAINKGLHLSKG